MATQHLIVALLIVLTLSRVDQLTCLVLKGTATCLDCDTTHDLSGIKILVKCNQVQKLAMATTEKHGSFETELPSDNPPTTTLNCQAKILGSSEHLYASKKNMITSIIVTAPQPSDSFALSEPLKFYTKCPLTNEKFCMATNSNFESSKTVDLPLPREWGLAPSSYYVPFIPIIGIPLKFFLCFICSSAISDLEVLYNYF